MTPELGVCYYPEHWPEEMWARDAQRMVETGIAWVRIGEFAWSRLEPEPSRITIDWLDRAIAVLADHGLKIVLGTPTATPPRWMIKRHPDMLAVDANGHSRRFGSRRHYCFSHRGYLDAATRVTEILGDRYGRDPRIHAWQIDNEYGCHETTISYSDAARDAFRLWLAREYGEIETLNAAWGNVFWSMEYSHFNDIDLPNLTVTQPNPSHELAFRRFSSDQVAQWNRAQAKALKSRTNAPLIHNYMGRVLEFDHFELAADLDIASWDSYPIGFLSDRLEGTPDHKAAYLQQGDPDMQAFHHDLYRAVGRGRWWVMEQQPGPVNWAPWNPAPLPGMVRLWSWEAFAHGAEVVSYFRWRQAPFAQEQMHAGLLRPDDADAPGRIEARQVADEIVDLGDLAQTQAPVALIFDYLSDWAWKTLPQGQDFDYFRLVFSAFRACRRAGLSVDILPASTWDFKGYELILAPGLAGTDIALAQALASAEGFALIGPRSFSVTNELTIPPDRPAIPALDLTITACESLPPDHVCRVKGGGSVRHWLDLVDTTDKVLMATDTGTPVLIGADTTCYLTGWPDDALWDSLISLIADAREIDTHKMPDGLRRRIAGDLEFIFNYGANPAQWRGKTLSAADVGIWRGNTRIL
ncbi:MAG: beta-galactosidase [Rhodobacteraceae bacterium]|nr:beta-galactosidase [Paracoccaceae bacterium]